MDGQTITEGLHLFMYLALPSHRG